MYKPFLLYARGSTALLVLYEKKRTLFVSFEFGFWWPHLRPLLALKEMMNVYLILQSLGHSQF